MASSHTITCNSWYWAPCNCRGATVFVSIPVRLVSEANMREHWATKHRRKKQQQGVVKLMFLTHKVPQPPVVVAMTRVGARKLDPDNLAGSFKHVQDAMADILGVDDGDESKVTWHYAQRIGRRGEYAVEIEVKPVDTLDATVAV